MRPQDEASEEAVGSDSSGVHTLGSVPHESVPTGEVMTPVDDPVQTPERPEASATRPTS